MKLCIAFGACATSISHAQIDPQSDSIEMMGEDEDEAPAPKRPATPAKKKVSWARAVIINDGAAVYLRPDFDSVVQDYLGVEMKVLVSRKPVRGLGGMGLFHQVRYGKKKGYIADTDIKAMKVAGDDAPPPRKKKSASKMWEEEEEAALGKAPLYFRRYLGGALAMVNFSEKFSGRKLSDDMLMYGIRMMGPGTLFDGPPLDFNFWFTVDKPDYYSKFASGTPNGFMLFGDVAFMMPFIDVKDWLATYGLGLMWVYTSYRVPVKSQTFDSQELRVGLDVTAGVSRRMFGKYLLRGDIKYYIEKTQYMGYMLSFMGEY